MPDLRRLTCGLVAAAHVALAVAIVVVWKLGPTVAVLDEAGQHGLHQGDALAVPLLALGALWFSRAAGAPLRLLPTRR